MPTFPLTPSQRRPRFWIVLPALLLILADAALTLLFQPASYWNLAYINRIETSPLGSAILARHPALFAAFILAWILAVVLLQLLLREPWNRASALAVVVGHTAGIYGWLVTRDYWFTIPTFVLVGILTVACWRTADAEDPSDPFAWPFQARGTRRSSERGSR